MNIKKLLASINPWAKSVEPGCVIIGHEPGLMGRPVYLSSSEQNSHVLVAGDESTNVQALGRSMLLQAIALNKGIIWLTHCADDGFLKAVRTAAADAGRSAALHVVDLGKPDRSELYNPLLAGTPEDQAQKLTWLLPKLDSPGAAYYRNECVQALAVIFQLFKQTGTPITLADTHWALAKPNVLLTLVNELSDLNPVKPRLVAAVTSLLTANGTAFKSDALAAFRARVQNFMLAFKGQGTFFGTQLPDIQVADSIENNDILIISLPLLETPAQTKSLQLMVAQDVADGLSKYLVGRTAITPKSVFLADLSADAVCVAFPERHASQLRGSSVGMVVLAHSIAQWTDDKAPTRQNTLLANMATRLLFKSQGTDSVVWANCYPKLSSADLQALAANEFYAVRHAQGVHSITPVVQG